MFIAEVKAEGFETSFRGNRRLFWNSCNPYDPCSPFYLFDSLNSLGPLSSPKPSALSLPLFDGDVMVQGRPGVNLARPVDARGGLHDLLVIGNPPRHAADGEHYREHLHRNANCAHDDAAVEVHIGIQLALDEVRIAESRFLEEIG